MFLASNLQRFNTPTLQQSNFTTLEKVWHTHTHTLCTHNVDTRGPIGSENYSQKQFWTINVKQGICTPVTVKLA